MAEQVQAILDEMVAPLADLQNRGIFTSVEIEQIVARRREFEYRLRRRQPRRSDYLQYLEMEETLEELRRLRTRRLNERSSAGGSGGGDSGHGHGTAASHTNAKHIGDVHGIKFLHLLWIRTLRKYRTVEMYLSYAQFCTRVQSYQRLTACYQDALNFFPHSVDLWIGAASHEYFGQQSIRAARILLQRALRIHAGSAEVWIQYFTLELHWRYKLLGRNKILRQGGDDDKETNVDDAEGTLVAVEAYAVDATDTSRSGDNAADDPYGMAKLVYTEAIKSKAATPELPWQFVAACQDFPVQDLQRWIVQGLTTTHTSEDTWIVHAKYLMTSATPGASGNDEEEEEEQPTKRQRMENPVLALLEQACNSLPTRKMFVNAIRFLDEYLEEQPQNESEQQQQKIVELQNKLFADATQQGLVNNELIQLQVDHLPSAREAIALLETYTTKKTKNDDESVDDDDGDLWIKYASLVLQEMGEPPAAKILETALTRIPMNKSDYVVVLVQLLGVRLLVQQKKPTTSNDKDSEAIAKLVQRLLLLSPAHPMASCDEPLIEQVVNAPDVLDLYLEHLVERKAKRSPMIIESIVASKCMDEWVAQAPDTVDAIIDKILMMEESDKKKQEVVFERAIRIFKDTPMADLYRRRRDDELRYWYVRFGCDWTV
jgi:U3 small nucleolar RNA-associated protein 6